MEKFITCPYQNEGNFEISTKDFGSTLFESLQKYSTGVAYENVVSGEKVTFDEVKQRAESLARHLLSFGISKGDVLAIFSPNSIEWAIVTAASLRIGVIVASINYLLTSDELLHHLKLSSANVLYTTQALARLALETKERFDQKLRIIIKGKMDGCISLDPLLHPSPSLPTLQTFEELNLKPKDTALIKFSSGTTGPQKAVMLTHRILQAQFVNMSHPALDMVFPDAICYLPFSHASGFYWMAYCPLLGHKVYIVPRFDFKLVLSCFEKYKTERALVVPTVATLLAKSPEVEKFSLSHLKVLWCGAASLGPETEALILKRLPGLSLKQCYGMTELAGIAVADPLHETVKRKPGSAGVPAYNMQIKVVDVQSGKSLGRNEQGEICMRGPIATPGYKNDPKASEELIDKDGWVHSGDIGYYDENSSIYVIDRIKELIKYNAYQVAPAELDTVLLSHPQVAEACSFGLPDVKAGELPTACVVLKPGAHITESELEQFVAGKVAPYKRLRGGIRFVQTIPKLSSGKLLRRQLKEEQLKARV